MAKLTLFVPKLTANKEDRTLSGLLLPFNEVGITNLGKITASADSKIDVADNVILNSQHDSKRPIGKNKLLAAAPEGIQSAWYILPTRDGDDALIEAEAGVRAALSVEMEPVVVRNGKLISGTITGAGLVSEPAFPSAKLAAEDAPVVPDQGEDAPDDKTPAVVINGEPLENVTEVTVTDSEIDIKTEAPEPPADNSKDENMAAGNATINNPALVAGGKKKTPDSNTLFAAFANAAAGEPNKMIAALSDVVPANILGIDQPQYVGELWDGVDYVRKFIPCFGDVKPLTSWEVKGWKWVTPPVVDKYTGNKAAIPSAGIETEEKAGVLQRFAGGHDIDRKYSDFSSPDFWAAYFAKMAESYSKVSDEYVRNLVREIPTAANGGRVHLLTGNAPAGVPTALWQIVEGCVKVLDATGDLPSFAWVTTDYWKPLLYTKVNDVLVYLNAALGLKEGTLEGQANGFKIIPVSVGSLTATAGSTFTGKVLVGHKNAVTVRELPGAPIRVEAIDVSKGGVDEALFGYVGTMVEDSDGIALFDAPAAS